MLTINLFSLDTETGELSAGENYYANYVSLVNSESFGKPPLIAPGNDQVAHVEDRVLYINTSLVPAFSIKREDD